MVNLPFAFSFSFCEMVSLFLSNPVAETKLNNSFYHIHFFSIKDVKLFY